MSGKSEEPSTSVKLTLGPVEITLSNRSRSELAEALKNTLSAVDSNTDMIKRLILELGPIQKVQKDNLSLPASSGATVGLSLAETVRKTGAKKGTDIALVIAHYLFKTRAIEVVNTKDLSSAYEEARLAKPSNLNETLNTLVRGGRMMEAAEKDGLKGFKITQTGENEIGEMLSKAN